MEMSEFLNREEDVEEQETSTVNSAELDVQKAVVESLAADKAEQDERIESLTQENATLKSQVAALKIENGKLNSEVAKLKTMAKQNDSESDKFKVESGKLKYEIANLKAQISEMKVSLSKVGDVLATNVNGVESNRVSLLDRDPEINDRFQGETRDHVLDAIRNARDVAEKEGRIRRAQLLESVLVTNEPIGNLVKKRETLEKFFNENGNLLSGIVIAELERCGISYKHGEDYLLPAEIIKRTY